MRSSTDTSGERAINTRYAFEYVRFGSLQMHFQAIVDSRDETAAAPIVQVLAVAVPVRTPRAYKTSLWRCLPPHWQSPSQNEKLIVRSRSA